MLALMEAHAKDEEREQEHGQHEPALGVAPGGAAPPRSASRCRCAGRARGRAGRHGKAADGHWHRRVVDPALATPTVKKLNGRKSLEQPSCAEDLHTLPTKFCVDSRGSKHQSETGTMCLIVLGNAKPGSASQLGPVAAAAAMQQ